MITAAVLEHVPETGRGRDEMEMIAYHEAGHCVAGCVLYGIAGRADIGPNGGHATTVRPVTVRRRSRPRKMVAAAGACATALAAGREVPTSEDILGAWGDLWDVGGSWSDRIERDTLDLLRRYWPAVETVAQVLAERGRVYAIDVVQAVVAVEEVA